MTTPYTAGNLEKLYYVPESAYGTTPTDALTWGAEIVNVKPLVKANRQKHILAGSRAFGDHTSGPWQAGYRARLMARAVSGGYEWTNFLAYYVLGAEGAPADPPLPSFSAQVSKKQGSNYKYDLYNGIKRNYLKIHGESPGQPIIFEVEDWAQFLQKSTSKTFTAGHQGVVVGANPTSDITTAILCWYQNPQINLGGGGYSTFYPKKWTLTIMNNLERLSGMVSGADGTQRPMATSINEGELEIMFECELDHGDETYTNAKLADTAITGIKPGLFSLADKSITLSNGYFPLEEDLPEYAQKPMEEGFTALFKSIAIA